MLSGVERTWNNKSKTCYTHPQETQLREVATACGLKALGRHIYFNMLQGGRASIEAGPRTSTGRVFCRRHNGSMIFANQNTTVALRRRRRGNERETGHAQVTVIRSENVRRSGGREKEARRHFVSDLVENVKLHAALCEQPLELIPENRGLRRSYIMCRMTGKPGSHE